MKKISFEFLNRLEKRLVQSDNEDYTPVSSMIARNTLIGAIIGVALMFIISMSVKDPAQSQKVALIGLCSVLGLSGVFSAYKTYKTMAFFPETKSKVILASYAFLLFIVLFFCFFYLIFWAITIFVLYHVCSWLWRFNFGGGGSGKKVRVNYRDGSSEVMVEDGKGFFGETYYKGDSGNTHVES